MPRVLWPLLRGRPVIEVLLTQGSKIIVRRLLADTGAAAAMAGFELLMDEKDCLLAGGITLPRVVLGGAYVGSYPA